MAGLVFSGKLGAVVILCRSLFHRPFNLAFKNDSFRRQFVVGGSKQELVQTTIVFDRADGLGCQAQTHLLAQHIAKNGNVLQIGQEAPACPIVSVTDIVASLNAFAR